MIRWFQNLYVRCCSPFVYVWTIIWLCRHADVFSRGILLRAIIVVAVISNAPSVDASSCQGHMVAGTIKGKTAYDPFSPLDIADGYQIAVANTGDTPCAYMLIFRSPVTAPQLGGTLTYYLSDGFGASLITNTPAGMASSLRTTQIPPGTNAYVEFQATIPRGQYAAPGKYADTLTLELHALDENSRLSAPPLQTTTIVLNYEVASILSVNIKGADATSSTTMRLGTLVKGQQVQVDIQARANQDYRLDLTSDNGSVLTLTPKVAGQHWGVPYTTTFGGQTVDLTSGVSTQNQPPTRPESDASFPLVVTVGDVSGKRAGRYEDVITIEIRSTRF